MDGRMLGHGVCCRRNWPAIESMNALFWVEERPAPLYRRAREKPARRHKKGAAARPFFGGSN